MQRQQRRPTISAPAAAASYYGNCRQGNADCRRIMFHIGKIFVWTARFSKYEHAI